MVCLSTQGTHLRELSNYPEDVSERGFIFLCVLKPGTLLHSSHMLLCAQRNSVNTCGSNKGCEGSDQMTPSAALKLPGSLLMMLKFQYCGYLVQRAHSLENTLMLGKIEGRKRRGQQRMRWLNGITNSVDMILTKFWERVKTWEAWYIAVHEVTKSWT